MLEQLRKNIVQKLWESYRDSTPDMRVIESGLHAKGSRNQTLDHFAVIDLPSSQSGIPQLTELFTSLGYVVQGRDYLAEKQNDFLWMAETNSRARTASTVLPQVVVADFRLDQMPASVRTIIEKYARHTKPLPVAELQTLIQRTINQDHTALIQCLKLVTDYLSGRDWPLPSTKEFQTVNEFNELLAWVLIFGRRPNHFTLSVHLIEQFSDLTQFHRFISDDLKLALNHEGGIVKGSKAVGIEQGSTKGLSQQINLPDGSINIPTGFVEFVWRYPAHSQQTQPVLWSDYFNGFIAQHANRVIESLYGNPQ